MLCNQITVIILSEIWERVRLTEIIIHTKGPCGHIALVVHVSSYISFLLRFVKLSVAASHGLNCYKTTHFHSLWSHRGDTSNHSTNSIYYYRAHYAIAFSCHCFTPYGAFIFSQEYWKQIVMHKCKTYIIQTFKRRNY